MYDENERIGGGREKAKFAPLRTSPWSVYGAVTASPKVLPQLTRT